MPRKDLTGKPTLMKELNIGLILDALAKQPSATRVELSAATGISQPTVNVLIRQLVEEGVVLNEGIAESTGGRKAELYSLNRKRSGILSVIVQKYSFEYSVTDLELNEECHETEEYDTSMTHLEQLISIIQKVCKRYESVHAVTVGVPGAVTAEGEVFAIPQIPNWEHLNLKQKLQDAVSLPTAVMNDINAIALGYSKTVGTSTTNMVYLHLGSNGTGAGIIIDGKLYNGCKSFAGEVGFMQTHSPYDAQGRIRSLEQILTGIICILNPEKIVIGGDNDTPSFHKRIINGAVNSLPAEIVPQFERIESGMEFYFKGLGKMGQEILDESVRLA